MCYFFIKETFALLQFSAKFLKFVLSKEIETLEFENEVFGLVAQITNINFRQSFQYLGDKIFSYEKSIFLK